MSDDFRRMPLTAEMNALQAEVRSHQNFVVFRRLEYRAVVANALGNAWPNPALAADSGNERFFEERQSAFNIARKATDPYGRGISQRSKEMDDCP